MLSDSNCLRKVQANICFDVEEAVFVSVDRRRRRGGEDDCSSQEADHRKLTNSQEVNLRFCFSRLKRVSPPLFGSQTAFELESETKAALVLLEEDFALLQDGCS